MENPDGPQRPMIITIDGPAGAGKTTISKAVAHHLGYRYIDTGALYRGIALAACRANIAVNDDAMLAALCQNIALDFKQSALGLRLMLNGDDIRDHIRTPEVTMMASAVSARPVIRVFLLEIQRAFGEEKAVVFEGRDMGTVVFPRAQLKVFLVADPAVRAQRRYRELVQLGQQVSLKQVLEQQQKRDATDSGRAVAPLRPAADAHMVDTSDLSIADVVSKIMQLVRQCGLG